MLDIDKNSRFLRFSKKTKPTSVSISISNLPTFGLEMAWVYQFCALLVYKEEC